MSLVCHFFGHRRSRSHATFDEKRQQWVSDCRRCGAILIREEAGRWNVAPPPPAKLVAFEKKVSAADGAGSITDPDPKPQAPEVEDRLERCAR